jgi:hypothetical protein
MPKEKKVRIKLIAYDRNELVVDTPFGRVVIDTEQVRFHRNGRGRGTVVASRLRGEPE